MELIAFDNHKHYTLASVEEATGRIVCERRIAHERGAILRFLSEREPGSLVAVETIGNWSWIVDEIEAAGIVPRLVHARKAKLMMGMLNKTGRLGVRGLNRLQRTGTLPVVWIPPGEVRDQRELSRRRMVLTCQRTQLKNRIQAILKGPEPEVDGVSAWTRADLCRWLEARFGKSYHPSSMTRVLRRMGFSRQKARPVHPKADPVAQESFKKRGFAMP